MKRLSTWKTAIVVFVALCVCALVVALMIVATPAAPIASQPDSPNSSLLGNLTLLMFAGVAVALMALALYALSNPSGKEETVPDWHVALIFKNRRFQQQTDGPTFHLQSEKGETFVLYDLREQSLTVEHKCDTADQISLEIKMDVRWQFTHKNDIHLKFLKESNDSVAALTKAAKSILSKQIAMRDYQRSMTDLRNIEAVLKADLPSKAHKYGIQINDVSLSEPRFNEALSQLVTASKAEAKRIRILDDVVAKTSDRTIDYILKSQGHAPREG